MQTLDIYGKEISSSFIEATESVAQLVKPLVIADLRDSRHLSNVVVTSNSEHLSNSDNEIGYYFDKYKALDGIEYESFAWGVADAKDNFNNIITACGKYRAMPSDLSDNLKYGWWSNSKSNSSGIFITEPYVNISFNPTIVNKIKIVTSRNHGQVQSFTIRVTRSNSEIVLDESISFSTEIDQFEKIINLNNTYTDINNIYVSVSSTKNPEDRARIVSVSPLYRVDLSDYVKDINDNRIRDLHETSLPIAGTSQSSCDISFDNTGKEFNLTNLNSQYGKFLEKDIRFYVNLGWLSYGDSVNPILSSLSTSLLSTEQSLIPLSSSSGFPAGDVDDTFDESKFFLVTINKNNFKEERVIVRKISGNNLVVWKRGVDGTDSRDHGEGDIVSFEPVEYVQIGERYVEEIRSSSNDMVVTVSCQDSSKFLNDKILPKGFFKDSSTVGEAIQDLLYLGNHPSHKVYFYDRYHNSPAVNNAILYLKFDDDPKNSGQSRVFNGLRFRVYQPPEASESSVKDIQLDVNEKELSDIDRALGLSSSVAPSFVGVKSSIDLVSYQLSSDSPSLNNSYYQGVIDGYLVPKNSYDPLVYTDGISISYDEGGIRLYIDDNLIQFYSQYDPAMTPEEKEGYKIDSWSYVTGGNIVFAPYQFIIGTPYKIRLEFYHGNGDTFDLSIARTDDISEIIGPDELLTNVINDAIGSRNPALDGQQKNHYRNDAVPSQFVSLLNNSSMEWAIDDKSAYMSNTIANTSVVDSFVRLPYHESWDVTNETSHPERQWSIEFIFKSPDGPYGGQGEYISSFANSNPESGIEFFYIAGSNHGVKVKFKNEFTEEISTVTLTSNILMPELSGWNHIFLTYSKYENRLFYYVDGDLHAEIALNEQSFPYWGESDLTFGGRGASFQANTGVVKPSSSVSSSGINLHIDEFIIYKKHFDSLFVKKRYIETKIKEVKIFPFLYGINESIYQTIQNISFADLGRMYIDENNMAIYEYYYALFEDVIDQHSNVQYEIADDSYIIDANIQKTLQVNSVIVKVAGVTASGLVTQSIWRASDPTTLGVINLESNISSSANSIPASSFDLVPFPKSGYIIIDNEIIKYNNKNNLLFLDAERGALGTSPASHNVNTKIREVRYFNFEYDKAPCFTVKPPFITGILFEDPPEINILKWVPSPFKGELIISASETIDSNTVVFAEGIDPLTNKVAYTAIAGVPIQVTDNSNQIIEQKAINSENRRKYGLKEVVIESPFITDASQAQILANFIIEKLSEPIPIMEINTTLIPMLQVGDRIKISALDQFDIINYEYWVTGISISVGSQYSQNMTLRRVV